MEVILDTNGLSAWLDGDEGLKLRLITVAGVWLSPIVLGEYRFGIKASRHRDIYERKLTDLELDIPTLQIDAATSISYAEIRQDLKKLGKADSLARCLDSGAGKAAWIRNCFP
jgi:predicted nucleic acid-binding protein